MEIIGLNIKENSIVLENIEFYKKATLEEYLSILIYVYNIKEKYNKLQIKLCSIINAKSGKCPENCSFCAQSKYHKTGIDIFPLLEPEKIFHQAKLMENSGAHRFSIVTSGTAIKSKRDKKKILKAIELIVEKTKLKCCASLGIIDKEFFKELKRAGLTGYHHNLETSKSFFSNICSTHDYEEDVKTVENAKELGFYTCSGGILGLGEEWEHRVELATTLKNLDVDSVPLNFLNPIKGTKLEEANFLTPLECLKIITLFRILLPSKDIRICGGREFNLRDLQCLIFSAGANGLMIGNYLTTKGRNINDDLQMIRDLNMLVEKREKVKKSIDKEDKRW